jgi:hypothetical protein
MPKPHDPINPLSKPSSYLAIRDHGVRTYGQLIQVARPDRSMGTCCACHKWGVPTWTLSTRASICEECCQRKATETLGTIAKAERAARRYVQNAIKRQEKFDATFYAHLARVPIAFIEALYTEALAKAVTK